MKKHGRFAFLLFHICPTCFSTGPKDCPPCAETVKKSGRPSVAPPAASHRHKSRVPRGYFDVVEVLVPMGLMSGRAAIVLFVVSNPLSVNVTVYWP